MSNFVKRLKTAEGMLEFSFMCIGKEDGISYYVSTVDKALEAYRFKMLMEEGKWTISERAQLPPWIQQLEGELSDAIIVH